MLKKTFFFGIVDGLLSVSKFRLEKSSEKAWNGWITNDRVQVEGTCGMKILYEYIQTLGFWMEFSSSAEGIYMIF